MLKVSDIRKHFIREHARGNFVTDKTGVKTIEMIGATFEADEPAIIGTPNEDYIQRELDWYKSMSLYVKDIPGGKQEANPPEIWMSVACKDGKINSNYGWAIWHEDNFKQYDHVLEELKTNPNSRRAVMIYTRPDMWNDYNENGRSDFMCTNTVQYLIRDDQLHVVVQMRSNDVVFGYRNDYAWQWHVANQLSDELGLKTWPKMIWHVGSLHVYERHFHLVK
jgi:thymidylate synthase